MPDTVNVKTTVRFRRWLSPNFANVAAGPGSDSHSIPVAELDQDALDALASNWLADLYTHAKKTSPFTRPI